MSDTRSLVTLSDTSPKLSEVYFQRLAAMTPSERLRIGAALGRRYTLFSSGPRFAARVQTPTTPKLLLKLR